MLTWGFKVLIVSVAAYHLALLALLRTMDGQIAFSAIQRAQDFLAGAAGQVPMIPGHKANAGRFCGLACLYQTQLFNFPPCERMSVGISSE